jgi:hypothetical protein
MHSKEQAKKVLNSGFGSPGESARLLTNLYLSLLEKRLTNKEACNQVLRMRASIYSANGFDIIDDSFIERILLRADGDMPFVIFADVFATNNYGVQKRVGAIIDNLDAILEVIRDNYNSLVPAINQSNSLENFKLKTQELIKEELGN